MRCLWTESCSSSLLSQVLCPPPDPNVTGWILLLFEHLGAVGVAPVSRGCFPSSVRLLHRPPIMSLLFFGCCLAWGLGRSPQLNVPASRSQHSFSFVTLPTASDCHWVSSWEPPVCSFQVCPYSTPSPAEDPRIDLLFELHLTCISIWIWKDKPYTKRTRCRGHSQVLGSKVKAAARTVLAAWTDHRYIVLEDFST